MRLRKEAAPLRINMHIYMRVYVGLHGYQCFHFEVYLRYLILELYSEQRAVMLVILGAPTVPTPDSERRQDHACARLDDNTAGVPRS